MAIRNPLGLRPAKSPSGEIRLDQLRDGIASGYATAIGTGDPVKRNAGTGKLEKAAPGDAFVAVFQGCEYIDSEGTPRIKAGWPANQVATKIVAFLVGQDDPSLLFEVVANASVAMTAIGQQADLTAGTVLANGHSTAALDASTIGTGDQVTIVDVVTGIDGSDGFGINPTTLLVRRNAA